MQSFEHAVTDAFADTDVFSIRHEESEPNGKSISFSLGIFDGESHKDTVPKSVADPDGDHVSDALFHTKRLRFRYADRFTDTYNHPVFDEFCLLDRAVTV